MQNLVKQKENYFKAIDSELHFLSLSFSEVFQEMVYVQ